MRVFASCYTIFLLKYIYKIRMHIFRIYEIIDEIVFVENVRKISQNFYKNVANRIIVWIKAIINQTIQIIMNYLCNTYSGRTNKKQQQRRL